MGWGKMLGPLLFLCLLVKPLDGLAVTFTVPEAKIEAYVQADGNVEVTESYLYEFQGDFNGLNRTMYVNGEQMIEDFAAFEDGKPLPFEMMKNGYRMFRPGSDEAVNLTIRYTIVDGVEKFEDGAQFSWAFFNSTNTTTYEYMDITIYPPAATSHVETLGYGILKGTEEVDAEGTVHFQIGEVKQGKKGDFRVAYPSTLFPRLAEEKGRIMDEIVFYDEERKEIKAFGIWLTVLIGCGLLFLFGWTATAPRHHRRYAVEYVCAQAPGIPDEKVSMPAVLHFIYDHTIRMNGDGSVEVAALLDLIRKGHVEQMEGDRFKLVDRTAVQHDHEKVLIRLLFDEIGDGVEFSMDDLKHYIGRKEKHRTYRRFMSKWKNGLEKELQKRKIIKRRLWIRLPLFITSLLTVLLALLFLDYELYGLLAYHIVFSIILFLTSIFYQPMARGGYVLLEEWKQFRTALRDPHLNPLADMDFNEQLRAYTFSVGMGDKRLGQQATAFTNAVLQTMRPAGTYDYANYASLSATFGEANGTTSSNGGSSGDGGSGGASGGGGAGAF